LGARRGSSSRARGCAWQFAHERADDAARIARRADRGAEIHQRLRIVAGALVGHEFRRARIDLGLGDRQRRLDCVKAVITRSKLPSTGGAG